MLWHLLVWAAMTVSDPATVGTNSAATAVVGAPVKEKKICRTVEPLTGTRIGGLRRVCRTQSQWDSRETETQRMMREIEDRGANFCPPNTADCGAPAPTSQPSTPAGPN